MIWNTLISVLLVSSSSAYKLSNRKEEQRSTPGLFEKRSASSIYTDLQYDNISSSYFVSLTIGGGSKTPQSVKMAVTSNAFTWIPGPLPSPTYCDNSGFEGAKGSYCLESNWSRIYDPSQSSTFSNSTSTSAKPALGYDLDFNITSIGETSQFAVGYFATDVFTIGQTSIDTVWFGIARNYTLQPEVGLGIPDANSNGPPSIIQVMESDGLINLMAYGIYLNDFESTSGAQLSIGSVDTSKYTGNFATFDRKGNPVTSVPLDSLGLVQNGVSTNILSNAYVDVEFSTTNIFLPEPGFTTVASAFNADYDNTFQAYTCDCAERYSNNSLTFAFDNVTINLNPTQFIIPAISENGSPYPVGAPICRLLMFPLAAGESDFTAILGQPFVRGAYVVHDFTNSQTSLAPARLNTTGGVDIIPLASGGVKATFNSTSTAIPSSSTTSTSTAPATPTNPGPATPTPTPAPVPKKKSNTGAIAGGVVGGVVVLGAIALLFLWRSRRRRPTPEPTPMPGNANAPAPPMVETTPGQSQYAPPNLGYYHGDPMSPGPSELGTNSYVGAPWHEGKGPSQGTQGVVELA